MKNNRIKTIEQVRRMLRGIGRGTVAGTAIERAANERRYKLTLFYRAILNKAI